LDHFLFTEVSPAFRKSNVTGEQTFIHLDSGRFSIVSRLGATLALQRKYTAGYRQFFVAITKLGE
jgi:hypothetical protein